MKKISLILIALFVLLTVGAHARARAKINRITFDAKFKILDLKKSSSLRGKKISRLTVKLVNVRFPKNVPTGIVKNIKINSPEIDLGFLYRPTNMVNYYAAKDCGLYEEQVSHIYTKFASDKNHNYSGRIRVDYIAGTCDIHKITLIGIGWKP